MGSVRSPFRRAPASSSLKRPRSRMSRLKRPRSSVFVEASPRSQTSGSRLSNRVGRSLTTDGRIRSLQRSFRWPLVCAIVPHRIGAER